MGLVAVLDHFLSAGLVVELVLALHSWVVFEGLGLVLSDQLEGESFADFQGFNVSGFVLVV